ncbi:hypothetical protein Rhopal_003526-T1 [Rhodotorula paludigena]|uniref:TauD/TfdA-like domain-containing protein n=1 Tax=Rhodotorula paludigena TaxID=86838 RepID=A0AAV5GDA9_9BASI|nr:hypothetical protein Rhopal_003526-T1 [Rhodotorula paludigena]
MSTIVTQTAEAAVAKLSLSGESKPAEQPYKFQRFLPEWTTLLNLPPLEPFEHIDPGHKALKDPQPRSFLDSAKLQSVTPNFGTEIQDGVDLTKLDARERAQIALFVAQRGFVVLRNQQNFIEAEPEWQINDWGAFFGRIHIHPVSGQPKDYPQLHLVWREATGTSDERAYDNKLSTTTVHSDVSYEAQPPGLTTLFLYDTPEDGGDTLFIDQVEAYKRLSPSFCEYLETLQVEHSGVEQYERAVKAHGIDTIKRQPVKNVHPLVRRHPVTGEKALYVNPGFSRRIIGLKQEESDAILNLLYDHISKGHDFQGRARWGTPGTVVLVTAHSALVDWNSGIVGRRHGARVTPQAERPFL